MGKNITEEVTEVAQVTKKYELKDYTILKYYVLKNMREGLKAMESDIAEQLKSKSIDKKSGQSFKSEFYDRSGCKISISPVKGKRVFSKEKAEDLLKKLIGSKKVKEIFTKITVSPKVGVAIPKELLAEMKRYFDINVEMDITEHTIEKSGVSKEALEQCWVEGTPTQKMNPDKRSSDPRQLRECVESIEPLRMYLPFIEVGE